MAGSEVVDGFRVYVFNGMPTAVEEPANPGSQMLFIRDGKLYGTRFRECTLATLDRLRELESGAK